MIKGFGITLEELQEQHLELVRTWRNSAEIAAMMEFNQYISAQEQMTWFNNLVQTTNCYFVIRYNNQLIGLTHLNKFDEEAGTAHAGLFIADKRYFGTGISFGVSLLILHHGFYTLNLNTIFAKVKTSNAAALAYNEILGYTFEQSINNAFSLYKLTKSAFEPNEKKLSKLLKGYLEG
jgi:RimJ/RimL family protein N-acetyltransferase